MAYQTSRTLHFGDCDPAGIAYFPSYLHHLVGVVEEFFGAIGSPWSDMIQRRRIGAPTVKLDLTFTAPGFHGDRLDFDLRVRAVGSRSLDLDHRVSVGDRLVWAARQVIVATSLDTHKALPWPDDIRTALLQHLETAP